MNDHTIASLAAKIAEIEASGTGRSRGPRSRLPDDESLGQAAEVPSGLAGDDVGRSAADEAGAPALPSRDVNDARGPAVVDLAGQLAHDEALGVGPDGRPLDAAGAGAPRGKRRTAKPAQLAFSEPEPHARALELAHKALGQREHTARQLRERLAKKGCEPPEIRGALEELERLGFVDDRRYAKIYAEDKRRLQGWGRRRIELELGRAGVARDVIASVFADGEAELDAPSELEAALELLRRKRPDLTDERTKARMAGMLARRGIASSTVYAALREHARRAADDG